MARLAIVAASFLAVTAGVAAAAGIDVDSVPQRVVDVLGPLPLSAEPIQAGLVGERNQNATNDSAGLSSKTDDGTGEQGSANVALTSEPARDSAPGAIATITDSPVDDPPDELGAEPGMHGQPEQQGATPNAHPTPPGHEAGGNGAQKQGDAEKTSKADPNAGDSGKHELTGARADPGGPDSRPNSQPIEPRNTANNQASENAANATHSDSHDASSDNNQNTESGSPGGDNVHVRMGPT